MLYGHVHDSHDERLIEQYQQMVEKTRSRIVMVERSPFLPT